LITPSSYKENLSKSEKSFSDKVKAYLKDPTEENVHDLRTSIRRLLTAASILPKRIRASKESRKYLDNCVRLLRLNTKVRDIDIILSKLPSHGDDPAYAKLARQLNKAREGSIKKGLRLASSIKDGNNTIPAEDLPSSKIQRRFRKSAAALSKRLKSHLRIVTKDPKNTAELHKLREDSRRLRFTLEMDDTPETSKLLPVLETWQDTLGKIRDSDIFISHFEHGANSAEIKQVLDAEKSVRNENYEKFLEIAKESPSFN
jgi:CHAD domain-containing protein